MSKDGRSINMNDKIEKAQTHRVTVEVDYVVITPVEAKLEGAQAMVERLVRGALEPLSPAKNLLGDVAVLLKVSFPTPKTELETLTEVPEGYEVLDSKPEEAEAEQPEADTRRDDGESDETPVGGEVRMTRGRDRVDGWTDEENAIVRRFYARHGFERTHRELRRAGHERTEDAVRRQASRIGATKDGNRVIPPVGRIAMRIINDVGPATVPELREFSELSDYSYYQILYALRKAERGEFVKGHVERGARSPTIRWGLTPKGRGMSYVNNGEEGDGEQAANVESRGDQDSQAHLPEVRA